MKNMFTLSTIILLITFSIRGISQNVGINDDNSEPDASAMLDIKSSEKGLLIPRLTLNNTTTADPVTNPATGLLIYANSASDVEEGFYYWNGSQWINLNAGITEIDTDSTNELQTLQQVLSLGNSAGNNRITDLNAPTTPQDAATKNYVDNINIDDADADSTNEIQDLQEVLTEGNNAGNQKIINLANPDDSQDAVTKTYVDNLANDTDSTNEIQNLQEVLTENNDAGNQKITNLANPTAVQDATTKSYVDNISVDDNDADTTNEIQNLEEVLGVNNSAGNQKISDLADPTVAQDAATKDYVDNISVDDNDANPDNEIQNLEEVLTVNNSAGNLKITNLSDPDNAQDAATKSYVDNLTESTANTDQTYVDATDWFQDSFIDIASVTVSVTAGQMVLIMFSGEAANSPAPSAVRVNISGISNSARDIYCAENGESYPFSQQFITSPAQSGEITYTLSARSFGTDDGKLYQLHFVAIVL